MLVRLVDELAHDLRHVGDRRHAVCLEAGREDATGLRVDQSLLRQRVADALDDAALDLAPRPERVDDPADVVGGGDTLDPHLARFHVVVDEPAEGVAYGPRALSPRTTSTCSSGTPSSSAAICASAVPGPVPMSCM